MQLTLTGVLLQGGAIIDLDATVIFQLLIFGAVFLVLRSLVFQPMLALFDARDTAIDGAKVKARALEADAEDKLRTFETEMKRVKVEATSERDRIRQDGARLERELVAKARTDAETTMSDATAQMASEAARVRADMKVAMPALAGQIADKLLGRKAS
jgi:F-type H+-transporting ATPase subunit b